MSSKVTNQVNHTESRPGKIAKSCPKSGGRKEGREQGWPYFSASRVRGRVLVCVCLRSAVREGTDVLSGPEG